MKLKGKRIGYVLTGSFCTFSKTIPVIKELVKNGAEVIPIMSYNSYNLDTKFGKAQDFIKEIEEITGKKIIHTIQEDGQSRLPLIKVLRILTYRCSYNPLQSHGHLHHGSLKSHPF